MRPIDEQALLDGLWKEDQKLFIFIWYEGISTKEMIDTLKKDYPEVFSALMTDLMED